MSRPDGVPPSSITAFSHPQAQAEATSPDSPVLPVCRGDHEKDPQKQTLNHGYLAVDFVFMLSGFVVAYAYDDRWCRMTQWDFDKRRLSRLQQMIIIGMLIGAALFWFQDSFIYPKMESTDNPHHLAGGNPKTILGPPTPRIDKAAVEERNKAALSPVFRSFLAGGRKATAHLQPALSVMSAALRWTGQAPQATGFSWA